MALSSSILTSLSTALGALTPSALRALGSHLSESNELAAMEVLDSMLASPSTASTMLPELTAIPNIPPQVMTWVNAALATPAGPSFVSNINQAKAALQTAVTSTSVLGNLF
jgi:hypothetical protein